MAKSVLLDVLEKTIGKYVLNLDANSLNVAIWSGKIELNSLQLDTKAVNFELSNIQPPIPFRVQSGHFVHFQVDVPWANLMSKPVVAHAKGLHVKIAPLHSTNQPQSNSHNSKTHTNNSYEANTEVGGNDVPMDPQKTSACSPPHEPIDPDTEARLRAIASADEYRQQANALRDLAQEDLIQQDESENKPSSSSFGAKLVRRIVENLQVEISDVHIVLESSECSAGVLLQSLNFETTDKDGRRSFVDRFTSKDSFLYKRLKVRGLGLYLDEAANGGHGGNSLLSSIKEQNNDSEDDHEDDAAILDHSYVLAPLSFEATLRQADSNMCIDHPKYLLKSELSSLSILLSKTQVQLAHSIARLLNPNNGSVAGDPVQPLFPEYRPSVRPVNPEAAKQWWIYAVRCVGRLNGHRLWVEFYRAFQKRKLYIPLYKRKMHHKRTIPSQKGDNKRNSSSQTTVGCHWLKPLSVKEEAQLIELELDRSISTQGLMTWRSIADGQVLKEKEKYEIKERKQGTTKSSLFTSLFGTSSSSGKQPSYGEKDPPIVLSPEELKELEDVAMEQQASEHDALSNESKMFDIQFVLRSFQVNLTTFNYTALALLKMGTVSTRFQSNADGSFKFDFALSNLSIEDKITPSTFFLVVLKNQHQVLASDEKAFSFHVNKTKSGDQYLRVQLSTFEAIASPNLVREIQQFLVVNESFVSTAGGSNYNLKANPLLAQSLSGSVDLFYDASEGPRITSESGATVVMMHDSVRQRQDALRLTSKQAPTASGTAGKSALSDNLSNALFDAWKVRTETRSSWLIDLDLQAPIVVLPETSTNANSTVIVFDFGHLKLVYGSAVNTPSDQVKQWFKANPKVATKTEREPVLDQGNLQVSSLSLLIGRVNDWKMLVKKHEERLADTDHNHAIVEPITLRMELGVEASSSENVPRVCAFGILPSISLALSPEQLARMLNVYKSWKKLMTPNKSTIAAGPTNTSWDQGDAIDIDENASTSSAGSRFLERAHRLTLNTILAEASRDSSETATNVFKQIYIDLKLRRLSINVSTDDMQQGMETHLVSVGCSVALLSSGLSMARLNMGWFWIVDKFFSNFARTQRLVVHSTLPVSASEVAHDSKYDIISHLDHLGVFEPTFAGSSELADVSVVFSPHSQIGELDPFEEESLSSSAVDIAANFVLDAKFSSLFVNWNPRAITEILDGLTRFTDFMGQSFESEGQSNVILLAPEHALHVGHGEDLQQQQQHEDNLRGKRSCALIRARMESVNLCLRSAQDDLPIFTLTMSSAFLSHASNDSENMITRATLGNISVSTPPLGRTQSQYHTLLGLSPGKSDSLLSVLYVKGDTVLSKIHEDSFQKASDLGEWALVSISPMRLVYIQAQVLALVEYATAGILGTLTSRAASSAASAAAEMASSDDKKKQFVVRATGFEVLLPEAAYSDNYFSVRAGIVHAEYTVLPDEKGAEAKFSMSNVMTADRQGSETQDAPIQMEMDMVLPPVIGGSHDDEAIRISIVMSRAPFLLQKHQYKQLLTTLGENIGEADLFLRDDVAGNELFAQNESHPSSGNAPVSAKVTHAGVSVNETTRSIYLDVIIGSLSIDLMGENVNDAIVKLKAERTVIRMVTQPHEERFSVKVGLRDLMCWDERAEAIGRNERALISQDAVDDDAEQHFFDIVYEKVANKKTDIGLNVGAPRIVIVPDAVIDVLGFFNVDTSAQQDTSKAEPSYEEERTGFYVTNVGDAYEVEARPIPFVAEDEHSLSFSLKTRQIAVAFVDYGSITGQGMKQSSIQMASVEETIVIRGAFDAKGSIQSRVHSCALKSAVAEIHGDNVEMYSALGKSSATAIQMLDPFSFSVYASTRVIDTTSRTSDFRLAVLSPIDMCMSMQNFALLNSIIESMSGSYDASAEGKTSDLILTSQDASLIEHLDHALEGDQNSDISVKHSPSKALSMPAVESNSLDQNEQTQSMSSMNITLPEAKVTVVNDLQGLDDPLIRFEFLNVVANARVREGERIIPQSDVYTGFDANLNCSIGSQYFESQEGVWKDFLLKPWEFTIRGGRGPNPRMKTDRPSTYVDVEAFPCHVCFSEEFLFNLASANRMWTVYSMATSSLSQALAEAPPTSSGTGQATTMNTPKPTEARHALRGNPKTASLKRSMAATAARTLVTALPYALENNSGVPVDFKIVGTDSKPRPCPNGSIEYFRFSPPKSKGTGGKRLYGQDVTYSKCVSVRVSKCWIDIDSIDDEGGLRLHSLDNGGIIFTQILKEGKTTVVQVSSGIHIHGKTSIPIEVRMPCGHGSDDVEVVGSCGPGWLSKSKLSILQDGKYTRQSSKLGLPFHTARKAFETNDGRLAFFISIVPNIRFSGSDDFELKGEIRFTLNHNALHGSEPRQILHTETVCRPISRDGDPGQAGVGIDSFVVQVRVIGRLVDQMHPYLDVFVEPRALIENKLPIPINIRTPMPQTYSKRCVNDNKGSTHELDPDESMEIYTMSQSVAVSVKCADNPVGGTPTGWIEGTWVDLPLKSEYRFPVPQRCCFPFRSYSGAEYNIPGGAQFLIVDGHAALSRLSSGDKEGKSDSQSLNIGLSESRDELVRTFFITVANYAVDHTGSALFAQVENASGSLRTSKVAGVAKPDPTPIGAYKSNRHFGRVSLLPESHEQVQLIHLTMEGDVGMRRSKPFHIGEVSICDGGVNSTAIVWQEDGSPSGFFAYQKLINTYQAEIHVIPEFIVFNGSKKFIVRVKQPKGADALIEPGKIAPLQMASRQRAIISVSWLDFDGATSPLSVDRLGLRIAIVRTASGLAIGSLAIQTVVGSSDSRLVVKLADIRLGSEARHTLAPSISDCMLDKDFLRFRIQWSELKVTLNEARSVVGKKKAYIESALDNIAHQQGADPNSRFTSGETSEVGQTWMEARSVRNKIAEDKGRNGLDAVCTLALQQFTVDWQRVFKEEPEPSALRSDKERVQSQERSQLSIIIHKIRITDETPGSAAPVVLDCNSDNASFFDLCVRVKGPLDAELVEVSVFDLNLAFSRGKAERIVLCTTESFAWKVLDVCDQIIGAAGEISGFELDLAWDEDNGGYKVVQLASSVDESSRYTPPNSEKLYDIRVARVSPFVVLLSFARTPVKAKYTPMKNGKNAALMNYFTQRLQFKIDRAELKFAHYEARNIRGPIDRVVEMITTVYISRMKLQFVTLMTAISVQDWKFLAARTGGDDEFVDGDLVRAAGNLAGNTVNYVLKGSGRGIESVLKRGSSSLGAGIESAATKVGAGALGSSVNSVVSGVGGGVGEAMSGVGSGAGHVVKGVGRGVGQVVGGVTGGASLMVRGTAKGIKNGDGKAIASSVVDGAKSAAQGVGQGVSSVVVGTADGVFSVGKGLFSGVRSVGVGVVGAVRTKKKKNSLDGSSSSRRSTGGNN